MQRFVIGPMIYQDKSDDVSRSSRRPNKSFTDRTDTSNVTSAIFRSPSKSPRTDKKSRGRSAWSDDSDESTFSKASRKSKKERKCEYSAEECPIQREKRDAEYLREKSNYEKRKREKIIELAKVAEREHEKLMIQRTRAQQTAKEIESSMEMEEDVRNRSMAKMKNQVDGMNWRSNRDLKDVKREIEEWKGKTAMSGELAKRVDNVEKRVGVLEKTDAERKKTMEMVDKNWVDFNRMKTQSMALEITQIKNRRGASLLNKMPDDVAKTTANNLYKLCSDLHRLSFHLNHKSDLTRLVDEALTLAEAIAPLYGPKEEFVDSRDNTSSTNVSLSNIDATSPGSAPTSPNSRLKAPIRSSLRRSGRDPATVVIPPLSKFDPNYSMKENQIIDSPSLREKSSNYYSDKEFATQAAKEAQAKEAQANCEPAPIVPQATPPPLVAPPPPTLPPVAPVAVPPTVQQSATPAAETTPPTAPAAAVPTAAPEAPPTPTEAPAAPAATPTPAAPAATPAAAPDGPSNASISLSVDSDRDAIQKEKKQKKRSRMRSDESSDTSTAEEPKPE